MWLNQQPQVLIPRLYDVTNGYRTVIKLCKNLSSFIESCNKHLLVSSLVRDATFDCRALVYAFFFCFTFTKS